MKLTILRALKILAVLLPIFLVLLLYPGNSVHDQNLIRNFYYEEPDSLDVVILGSSEVFTGYSAALAYEEFGFTSLTYATSGNRMDWYLSQLTEIYNHQSPSLLVVDITPGMYPSGPDTKSTFFRNYVGGMPLSANKIRTIYEFGDRDQWLSYYIPFFAYHDTVDLTVLYDVVSEQLFYNETHAILKNNFTTTSKQHSDPVMDVPLDDKRPLDSYNQEILRTLLEYCKQEGLENVLFVTFPHRISTDYAYDRSLRMHTAGDLIASYGYPYLNMDPLLDEIGLDTEQDYYNDEHLNLYGQKKLTRYLASLFTVEYGVVPASQSEKNKTQWDTASAYYHAFFDYFNELYHTTQDRIDLYETREVMLELEQRVAAAG